MLVEHNVGLQLNVSLKGQRGEVWGRGGSVKEEGREGGIHIKDLDYRVEYIEERAGEVETSIRFTALKRFSQS